MNAVVFTVTPERRAAASRARATVLFVAAGLVVLAVVALLAFPPGTGTRASLSFASILLLVLAGLVALRLVLVARKADRFVAPDGAVLWIDRTGITVAGDIRIPLGAVSGAWGVDRGPVLRQRAANSFFGAPGRVMLRAGVNTADITIGITDVRAIEDPSGRVKRFRALPSGLVPGRVEIPFGAQFDTPELHAALRALRAALPLEVPVRLSADAFDYAAAWAGTADDVAAIRRAEASRTD